MTAKKPIAILLLLTILVGFGSTSIVASQSNVVVTGNPQLSRFTVNRENYQPATLRDFIGQVKNGQANTLVGVYIDGVLALPIVQQPSNNATFVSSRPNTITQFGLASKYGTTGLLAHNTLSGELFFKVGMNANIVLIYGDGTTRHYLVTNIQKYQALSPHSPYSDFTNLAKPSEQLSSADLFARVYKGGDQVVLQTCITGEGNPSWGRIFITAKPFNQHTRSREYQRNRMFTLTAF